MGGMGYNARNDEIRDNVTRMRREWETQRGALATVRRFNATLSAKGYSWFWPKIAAALISKHHWLVINCDSCGTVMDLDLRVKPRDPEASVRVALHDVQCPRCNGNGRFTHHCAGAASVDVNQGHNHMAKKREARKTKRKRIAKKKRSPPKVDVITPDVPDEALERAGALTFTRYGCP